MKTIRFTIFSLVILSLMAACGTPPVTGSNVQLDSMGTSGLSPAAIAIPTTSGGMQTINASTLITVGNLLAPSSSTGMGITVTDVMGQALTVNAAEKITSNAGDHYALGMNNSQVNNIQYKIYAANDASVASFSTFGTLEKVPNDNLTRIIVSIIVAAGTTMAKEAVLYVAEFVETQPADAAPKPEAPAGQVVLDGDGLVLVNEVYDNVMTVQPVTLPDGRIIIPVSPEHHQQHSPESNAEARARVELFLNTNFVDPPKDPNSGESTIRCLRLMLGDIPVRYIIWQFTHFSATGIPRGNLNWFDPEGWKGSYPNKSGDTLKNVPGDLKDNPDIRMEEVSCFDGNFPPPPALVH